MRAPITKPPEFAHLSHTGPIRRPERRDPEGPLFYWGARIRRRLGEGPRNNGPGAGEIRPNALIRPVIALSFDAWACVSAAHRASETRV